MNKMTIAVPVDLVNLQRIGQRPNFGEYIMQLWNRRAFIIFDAKARVQSGHENHHLGSLWLILTPLLSGISYYLIFGVLLNTQKGIENFIGYLMIGVFTFQMTTRSIIGGAGSISGNRSMIRAFQFPRAALPIALNIRELLSSIPVTIVMLIIIIISAPNEEITWRWLLIIPIVFLQFIFNMGIGMILARAVSKIPDLSMLLSFIMRLWLYASAVFFAASRWDSVPLMHYIMEINPIYIVIRSIRESVLYATTPSLQSWVTMGVWAAGAFAVGLVVFWHGEESYGRA